MNTHVSQLLEEINDKIADLISLREALERYNGAEGLPEPDRSTPPVRRKHSPKLSTQAKVERIKADLLDGLPDVFGVSEMCAQDAGLSPMTAQGRISNWLKVGKIERVSRGKYRRFTGKHPAGPVERSIQEQIEASERALQRAKESGNDALAALHQKQIDKMKNEV